MNHRSNQILDKYNNILINHRACDVNELKIYADEKQSLRQVELIRQKNRLQLKNLTSHYAKTRRSYKRI